MEEKNVFSWFRNTDILLALGIVVVLLMLIIPIPEFLLDLGMATSIAFSFVILLTVVYVKKATEFSVFPTLILFSTVFRIALNVSSTRLILLKGEGFDGQIIRAFGDFVVGGNYVIGLVIFLILVAVQVVVITKGATRVSEVAARFTLDALPGKQMEITNELSSNLISDVEAKKRKKEVEREANFYGAMDGASKFVQGDVRLGILITLINLIGGILVGLIQQNMSFSEAGRVFLQLTVGDGLVSQIPSLMMSVATGVIVTRSASDGSFGVELVKELTFNARPFYGTGGFLILISFLPGFPMLTLWILAFLFIGAGVYVQMNGPLSIESAEERQAKKEAADEESSEEDIYQLVNVDPMELEIGFGLISLVDVKQGGDLLERIKLIRRTMVLELGLIVPPIRIRDNIRLEGNEYVIKIRGIEVAKGRLRIDKYLAIPSYEGIEPVEGIEGEEPIYHTPSIWVEEKDRLEAERLGYSVVDAPTIIATHLTETLRSHGADLLGRQEVKKILDSIRENYPVICTEAEKIGIGVLQKILQGLLQENVSIRNIVEILEIFVDAYQMNMQNPVLLVEHIRQKLAPQIIQKIIGKSESLNLATISDTFETALMKAANESNSMNYAHVDIQVRNQFLDALQEFYKKHMQQIFAVMCHERIRPIVRDILKVSYSRLPVLSYTEVSLVNVKIQHLGVIEGKSQNLETPVEE